MFVSENPKLLYDEAQSGGRWDCYASCQITFCAL